MGAAAGSPLSAALAAVLDDVALPAAAQRAFIHGSQGLRERLAGYPAAHPDVIAELVADTVARADDMIARNLATHPALAPMALDQLAASGDRISPPGSFDIWCAALANPTGPVRRTAYRTLEDRDLLRPGRVNARAALCQPAVAYDDVLYPLAEATDDLTACRLLFTAIGLAPERGAAVAAAVSVRPDPAPEAVKTWLMSLRRLSDWITATIFASDDGDDRQAVEIAFEPAAALFDRFGVTHALVPAEAKRATVAARPASDLSADAATGRAVAETLTARLGDDEASWTLALQLAATTDSTVAGLADTVASLTGGNVGQTGGDRGAGVAAPNVDLRTVVVPDRNP